MEHNQTPILGTSLYSFVNEIQQQLYDFDGLVAKVAKMGLGPALDVVGFQNIPGYPEVTSEFVRHFRDLMDHYGLIPTCLKTSADLEIGRDRVMSSDETFEYINLQIAVAKKLGFPIICIRALAKPDVLERVVTTAERAGIQVATELIAPLSVETPEIIELLEYYQKVQSPVLGFIPNLNCTMRAVPDNYWSSLKQIGAPDALIESAKSIWKSDAADAVKYSRLQDACRSVYAAPTLCNQIKLIVTRFGRMPVNDWQVILPYTRHIHGRFYDINSDGVEPFISYSDLTKLLKTCGFSGTLSAEWDGHVFTDQTIGFQQVEAWHAMCCRLFDH